MEKLNPYCANSEDCQDCGNALLCKVASNNLATILKSGNDTEKAAAQDALSSISTRSAYSICQEIGQLSQNIPKRLNRESVPENRGLAHNCRRVPRRPLSQ